MIFLCLFYLFQLFSCECENIPVANQQPAMVFPKLCDKTLSTITLRCPRPPLQTCSGHFGGAPKRLAGRECGLLFVRVPLPKGSNVVLFILRDDRCSMSYIFRNHQSNKLLLNLSPKRFYIRVFLLDYMLASANEYSLSGFGELLFVWPLPFDLFGMGFLAKKFYFLPA